MCHVGDDEMQGICVLFATKESSVVSTPESVSCMDGSEGIAVFFAATRQDMLE